MELLTNQIRINKNIKGITIAGCELKDTCYADDASFILDGSKKSFETLIDVLENFRCVSGLKLNANKCQVLRIGATKNTNIIYLEKKKFQWSSTVAKALGMFFSTNREQNSKLNLDSKIKSFENCLKQWQHRKLTLMGKVTVIKTFALPKLIYALSSLPTPSKFVLNQIEKLMYAFIWENKPEKVKRSTLTQEYEMGGIKMVDIEKFIQSLKISWIKRILNQNSSSAIQKIYLNKLNNYGNKLYFECDFHEIDIHKSFEKKSFFTDILIAWSKLNKKDTVLNYSYQIIWNNSNIKVATQTIMYKNWYQAGIKYLKDIYDYTTKKIYSFEKLRELYNLPYTDFLKYLSLIQSIPNNWKGQLKHENINVPCTSTILTQLLNVKQTNKFIYNILLKSAGTEEKRSEEKWNNIFSDEELNWKIIYSIPLLATHDVKLRNFQYKYLNRILPTNQFLNKCKLVSSSLCDFCNMEIETLNHLFWECRHVQSFWMELKDQLNENNIDIEVTFKTIAFGIQERFCPNIKLKNFIILIAKYFIFINKYNKSIPVWQGFRLYIRNRIRIEKEIALTKNRLLEFERLWANFVDIF